MRVWEGSWSGGVQYDLDVTADEVEGLDGAITTLHVDTLAVAWSIERISSLLPEGLPVYWSGGGSFTAREFAEVLDRGLSGYIVPRTPHFWTLLADTLLTVTPVPVLRSAPERFTALGSLLGGGVAASVVQVAGEHGESRPVVFASALGVTVFISVVVPPLRALGRGLESRVLQAFNLEIETSTTAISKSLTAGEDSENE
jgi:hypothetical protein